MERGDFVYFTNGHPDYSFGFEVDSIDSDGVVTFQYFGELGFANARYLSVGPSLVAIMTGYLYDPKVCHKTEELLSLAARANSEGYTDTIKSEFLDYLHNYMRKL